MNAPRNEEKDFRTEILNTARAMLVSEGYGGLSMRKIAKQLGCSPASLYLHFNGKDVLFQTLVEEGMERLYGMLERAAAGEPEDAVARFEALCLAYVEFGLSEPEYYEIMFMTRPQIKEEDSERHRVSNRHLRLITWTITEGNRQGHFYAPDPAMAARTVWGLLHGTTSLALAQHLDRQVEAPVLMRFGIATLLRAFARTG